MDAKTTSKVGMVYFIPGKDGTIGGARKQKLEQIRLAIRHRELLGHCVKLGEGPGGGATL